MTRWVAWCWVWALAGLAASGALAQKSATPPLDAPAASESSTQRAQAAFVLQIEAPDDIKTLLEKYLELVRFRALPDLTEAELARLALEAPNNIRELVATLGYFAPEVAVDVQTGGDSGSRSTFSIRVTPGQATRVSEVDISLADAATASPEAQQRREEIADQWSLIPT
ncbi:MAG: outer membrane protein assembly factor, partial [Rhodoferax sp.]|nr:outer membrane protein assembly factor [Rhodoferax sp.]